MSMNEALRNRITDLEKEADGYLINLLENSNALCDAAKRISELETHKFLLARLSVGYQFKHPQMEKAVIEMRDGLLK